MVTRRIFVNRSLALEKIKCFGFDMDYTLASAFFFWGGERQDKAGRGSGGIPPDPAHIPLSPLQCTSPLTMRSWPLPCCWSTLLPLGTLLRSLPTNMTPPSPPGQFVEGVPEMRGEGK